MVQAYSRLKHFLSEKKMTVPELHRRIQQQGWNVNLKSLYRLTNDQQPVERLDLRVAGAVCQVCQIPLSELIAFTPPQPRLRRLAAAKQKRLETLMAKNNEGQLTRADHKEFQALAREAEELALDNARLLQGQRRQLAER